MRIRIKRANMKRLASLSALGAGALAVTAGTAEAGIIYTPLVPSPQVGFSGGYNPSTILSLPGTARIGVKTARSGVPRSYYFGSISYRVLFSRATGGVTFKGITGRLGIFDAGKTWSSAGGSSQSGFNIATRRLVWYGQGSVGAVYGNPSFPTANFPNKYALFRFWDTSSIDPADWKTEDGWLQLSLSITDATGPDVTLEGWAYEDTGAVIAAGDTGTAVPEPSTMALAGLAALALGATGLRRWRAARKPAA